jgi:acylphosphatase
MTTLRRRLSYEGRVQGVGFRMTAYRLSTAFPVAGYVRNLDDGRVELVAEGEPQALASFLQAIQREFGEMITAVEEVEENATGESFVGFMIRY